VDCQLEEHGRSFRREKCVCEAGCEATGDELLKKKNVKNHGLYAGRK